ncbi:TATA-binding protein-associated factor [Martiniozyma asiatica (nom. inval.)]|nr:TATA-binding protein-associated factor [Martiniozyma asiatica]
MVEVKRTVRITTSQHVLADVEPVQEGFPMREWTITLSVLDSTGNEIPATLFDKVTYSLHPTFPNPVRSFKKPPFAITEQGWGGFDIPITLSLIEKGGNHKIHHDLNFFKDSYVVDKEITINTTKAGLLKELAKSGTVPQLPEAGDKRKGVAIEGKSAKKAKTAAIKGGVDLERMADLLARLKEDDLLGVVQMINDNRVPEMNIKNDIENGEFTMDLYTLPDGLLKSLWDYIQKRAD